MPSKDRLRACLGDLHRSAILQELAATVRRRGNSTCCATKYGVVALPRRKSKSCVDIRTLQARIVFQDLLVGGSAGEQLENIYDPYAQPSNTGFPATNIWVYCDSLFHTCGFRDRPPKSSHCVPWSQCANESTLNQSKATQFKPVTHEKSYSAETESSGVLPWGNLATILNPVHIGDQSHLNFEPLLRHDFPGFVGC